VISAEERKTLQASTLSIIPAGADTARGFSHMFPRLVFVSAWLVALGLLNWVGFRSRRSGTFWTSPDAANPVDEFEGRGVAPIVLHRNVLR